MKNKKKSDTHQQQQNTELRIHAKWAKINQTNKRKPTKLDTSSSHVINYRCEEINLSSATLFNKHTNCKTVKNICECCMAKLLARIQYLCYFVSSPISTHKLPHN